MEGENGLYVIHSVCFPMTRQLREHIENCVLEKYQASLDPVDWKVRFRLDNDALETIVNETDRSSAIETARAKLATRFGNALENAEVEK